MNCLWILLWVIKSKLGQKGISPKLINEIILWATWFLFDFCFCFDVCESWAGVKTFSICESLWIVVFDVKKMGLISWCHITIFKKSPIPKLFGLKGALISEFNMSNISTLAIGGTFDTYNFDKLPTPHL